MGLFDRFKKKAVATVAVEAAPMVPGEWVVVCAPSGLEALVASHAATAHERGVRAYLYLSAPWAPPCRVLEQGRADPALAAALAPAYLIELADAGDLAPESLEATRFISALGRHGVRVTYPSFFELDAAGQVTGRSIDGSAWTADTVENMAVALAPFFHVGGTP